MVAIDYSREPKSDIAFVDMKSFYASVECVTRNLHPLTTSLCVMSRSDNSSGLILASSPTFKKVFGKSNVGRAYDLPFDIRTRKFSYQNARRQGIKVTPEYVEFIEYWAERTLIVPPRMAFYIEENLKIQEVLESFAPKHMIHPYSIDEAFIDLTQALNYFMPNPKVSSREKLDVISAKIQKDIWEATGVFSTIGMSNANPLLAKLALDNEAKKTPTMRANWSYEDVQTKVWAIPELTDFWGIGRRTEKRLNKLGIHSIKDLALANPDDLKKEFGIIGVQLWFHANGIDESNVSVPYRAKQKGLGNSQILPRDYTDQQEIEIVLKEMAEQVAIRIRRIHKKAGLVAIHVGFSMQEDRSSIQAQMTIDPTNSTQILSEHVIRLFRQKYDGGTVRSIGIRYGKFVDENYSYYSLFDDIEAIEKMENFDQTIDQIREKHGFLAVQRATSLMRGSRVKARSSLIGGHCGGLEGIQ